MEMNRSGKQSISTSLFLVLLFTLLLVHVSSADASAASTAIFDGVWIGTTTSDSSVTLNLEPKRNVLRYGSPRNCEVALGDYIETTAKSRKYEISRGGQGFCTQLGDGKLLLQFGGDGESMTYEAQNAGGVLRDRGNMRRLRE